MTAHIARLRRLAPLGAFLITVGAGWATFVRPLVAERVGTAERLNVLTQREAALRAILAAPSGLAVRTDPVAAFERRVASGDPTLAVVERLARLASNAHVRDLFIETVEGTATAAAGAPLLPQAYRPDPRISLFDGRLAHTPITMSFTIDYAGLGRFLWELRDLPTLVEVRALNVQPRIPPVGEEFQKPDGTLRASLTFAAYSRPSSAPTSGTLVTP